MNNSFINGEWYENQYKTPGSRYYDIYVREGISKDARDMNYYHAAWVAGLLSLYSHKHSIFELGAGCGYYLQAWECLGFNCSGIEISKEAIKKSVTQSYIMHGSAVDLSKYHDKAFDLCFSCSFLEHIDSSITKQVILESVRIAKMGAHYISTTVGDDESHIHVQDAEAWIKELQSYLPEDYAVMGLTNFMSEDEPLILIVRADDAPVPLRQIAQNYRQQQ